MESFVNNAVSSSPKANVISKTNKDSLDSRLLYEAVIGLSTKGLITANCLNMAAGILQEDLGLPQYFFQHIQKDSLSNLLQSIATSIQIIDGKVMLCDRVAHIDFDLTQENAVHLVRIATAETRDNMEMVLAKDISGHRRDYYYSPESNYYTYIIHPETVDDFANSTFTSSKFLFSLTGNYEEMPAPTRKRYENHLIKSLNSVVPLIEIFNLPETGETRLMFNSDFESPQLPILRKLLEDHGLTLLRAYWEPYLTTTATASSICALYVQGELTRKQEAALLTDIRSFLAFSINKATDFYLRNELTFKEMLFAGNAIDFTHLFIYKESDNATDRAILESLVNKDHQDAFSKRLQSSNKSIYGAQLIEDIAGKNSDLFTFLFDLFQRKYDPTSSKRLAQGELKSKWQEFDKIISSRFIDCSLGYDIFKFMFKIVTSTLKTNFYKEEKRSFAFRFDSSILDPLVFSQPVYAIFYINGHYACGTHLRADDIARGGLRLLRISKSNHAAELDSAVLLNYALGPKAQRLKHKDICESGAKGVVVPHPHYARYSEDALLDYTEGMMDLMLLDDSIVDYYGRPELLFFGPDEGTAPLMDGVALRAKARGYKHWRTITTGKSFGIPHDTYGMLDSGELFGLNDLGSEGVELQINGTSVLVTDKMEQIYAKIGGRIDSSGMTTSCIMSCFRTLISHYGSIETELNLMITGGPDGDLGANEIQCYKGNICLLIDGGSILFDPKGLDKKELMKIAFKRNSSPRQNSTSFPLDKLSKNGFMVPLTAKNIHLPDGSIIEDGALFHRTFLANSDNRKYIQQANIEAFIPCGGFKDTINQSNVKAFSNNFQELKFIVEGANVFFDDVARRYIATKTKIKHIKDSTANKGGVFSSSIAEVLTGFLFQEQYEEKLLNDPETRCELIKNIIELVQHYAKMETTLLIQLHEGDPSVPLFDLSEQTSELIFTLQDKLMNRLDDILADADLVWQVMKHYLPPVLISKLGRTAIMSILNGTELQAYRDAIVTKKLASMAFYKFGRDWKGFLLTLDNNFMQSLHKTLQ